MAKQSFKKATPSSSSSAESPAPSEESSPSKAVAVREDRSPAKQSPTEGVEGSFDMRDYRLPRLNVAQKIGPLSEKFDFGAIIFDKEVILSPFDKKDKKTTHPVKVYVLRLKKRFQEAIPYAEQQAGREARFADTPKQVAELGGTTEYSEKSDETPFFGAYADMMLLVEATENVNPDDLEVHFPFEVEGKRYALVMLTVAKGAYRSSAREVVTRTLTSLKSSLYNHAFILTAEQRTGAAGTWVEPAFKVGPKTSEPLAELIRGILNPKAAAEQEAAAGSEA